MLNYRGDSENMFFALSKLISQNGVLWAKIVVEFRRVILACSEVYDISILVNNVNQKHKILSVFRSEFPISSYFPSELPMDCPWWLAIQDIER